MIVPSLLRFRSARSLPSSPTRLESERESFHKLMRDHSKGLNETLQNTVPSAATGRGGGAFGGRSSSAILRPALQVPPCSMRGNVKFTLSPSFARTKGSNRSIRTTVRARHSTTSSD